MLAGVDCVLMGAGIPTAIPGILDDLAEWKEVELKIHTEDNPDKIEVKQFFDPKKYCCPAVVKLKRPAFLAIITSHIVGKTMLKKATGSIEGFVVENHLAGGHNAPPRGKDADGKPMFGDKDAPNLEQIKKLDRPFWIAGGYATAQGLQQARELGAQGIQVGTIFAYCDESGVDSDIKKRVIELYQNDELEVETDFQASPTGYPFKLIDNGLPQRESRPCDLGYLRETYIKKDCSVGYRCPSEALRQFIKKGGTAEQTEGKQCLCNGLMATIGLPQTRKDMVEPPMITAGSDFSFLGQLLTREKQSYRAADALQFMLT